MRHTKELPREGTWRTRLVRAWLPKRFEYKLQDGTPVRTWIWLELYEVDEVYQYGYWQNRGSRLL